MPGPKIIPIQKGESFEYLEEYSEFDMNPSEEGGKKKSKDEDDDDYDEYH